MQWSVLNLHILPIIFSFHALAEATFQRSRPVVGILSQPHSHGEDHYIAASYVKWLESAGARSIAIPYDADDELLHEIFSQINGVLFPGGDAPLPPAAKSMWNMILERNQNENDFFPAWGTCLGFEFMLMLAAGSDNVLQKGFDAENISLPLIFPSDEDVRQSNGVYSIESQLYSTSSVLRQNLLRYNITMNNHHLGITPSNFMRNSELTDMFHITSTNVDRQGKAFVSTIESKTYPIYGIQYHPEKNNFEFGLMDALQPMAKYYSDEPYEVINHSEKAVELSLQLALFFVGRVRRSTFGSYNMTHRHPTVYHYPMVRGRGFEQEFTIPKADHWQKNSMDQTGDNNIHNIGHLVFEASIMLFFIMSSFIIFKSYNFSRKFVKKSYSDIPDSVSMELLTEDSFTQTEEEGN